MERRAEFDLELMEPDLGQPIIDHIKDVMRSYRKDEIAAKQRARELKESQDFAFLLHDLATALELQLPKLEFEPLKQPTPQEIQETYLKYYDHNIEYGSRNGLQTRIEEEFERLTPLLEEYELIQGTTFLKAKDQRDFEKRIHFMERLAASEVWDTGTFLNDDVYRTKQREKMRSMLSPFDTSILNRPDPPLLPPICHPELHLQLSTLNFTFEKQFCFYYQWYADHQYDLAIKEKSDFSNFYKTKRLYETPETRQNEGKYKR